MTRGERLHVAKKLGLNAICIAVLIVFTFAEIDNRVAPFALAFLFACVNLPVNKIAIGLSAFLFSLFTIDGRNDVIANAAAVSIFVMLAYVLPLIREKCKDSKFFVRYRIEYVLVFVAFAFASMPGLIFVGNDLVALYIQLTSFAIGLVFLAACLVFINAFKTRFNKIPWTLDQRICAGVFAVILSLGIIGFDHDYFSFHKFAAVLLILLAAVMLDARISLVTGACMGLGAALVSLDLTYIAIYVLFALAAVSFKTRTRYLSVISVIIVDVVLGYYFNAYGGYGVFELLPLLLACVMALLLPRVLEKHFDFSKSILSGYLVSKNTINKNRAGVYKRMDNLSSVFNEMQNIYKNLVTGSVPREESSKMISRQLADNICSSCPNRNKCRRDTASSSEVDSAFEKLCYVGLQRGSVNFLDLPADMSVRCTKLNTVLNMANASVGQVQIGEQARLKTDAGKILMAGLLSGLSKLCKSFAGEIGGEVIFDLEKGQEIRDALLAAGIVASDCLITKSKSGDYSVSILVTRHEAHNTAIERVISTAVGHRFVVDTIDDAETAGFAIVTVKTAPRYNLTFGVAQVAKDFNPNNGDAFSFLKITSDKTMMSVCDGMGTGERARRASVLALSLVENFYKAGFPNEIIMESVNQLLIITGQEGFSAIDIAVFDGKDGGVGFIKVGGVEGFIKRPMEVEIIEAGSLPLGIVEEMVPKITRAYLSDGDMAVLCSDGVTDSFGDRMALGNFINNLQGVTPQKLADEVIAECLRRTDKIAIDDCTVVVARLDDTQDIKHVLASS